MYAFDIFLLVVNILLLLVIAFMLRVQKADGQMIVKLNDDGSKLFSLELDQGPDAIEAKKKIIFRVKHI